MSKIHIVKQGECLSRIAHMYGFADWHPIYEHESNRDFRRDRPDPNLIFPGDEVSIPDIEPQEESRQTGTKHRFRAPGKRKKLRIVISDPAGHPISSGKYRLLVEGAVHERALKNGIVEHTVPVDAEEGELTVWFDNDSSGEGVKWTLQIGHLDPLTKVSGVQGRLRNLGFDGGPVDGIDGPRTQAGVREFQENHGLKVDGIVGNATRSKLKEVYGC